MSSLLAFGSNVGCAWQILGMLPAAHLSEASGEQETN